MQRLNRTVALVAMLLLLPAALSAQEELPHTYRGTVHAVHAGSVDLVTGVGYALRLVHLRMQPTTHISGDAGPLALRDVRPGDVMRADCRLTADGVVAERIELRTTAGRPRSGRRSRRTAARPRARAPASRRSLRATRTP